MLGIKKSENSSETNNSVQNADVFINPAQENILNRYLLSIDKEYSQTSLITGKVCIYRFEGQWEEMAIEGSLYLYKRSSAPKHRMIVFNRKSLGDFKLNIPESFYLEYENQFVIFSHLDKKNIFGFWFEEIGSASKFFEILKRILELGH